MLIVIDPRARQTDGEAVRIARDVLCAGARDVQVCVLDRPQALPRILARRGGRRVVIVGDDGALLRAVRLLHAGGELGASPLAMVPVGPAASVRVARALGVPTDDAVAASRAVLTGPVRTLDVLTDDAGGVVLGALGIPAAAPPRAGAPRWWRPRQRQRLRVEADGKVLADVDRPVEGVSVRPAGGLAEVVIRPGRERAGDVRARATTVTVSAGGRGYLYRADAVNVGPTPARTWTVSPGALRLTVPAQGGPRPGS
ncbi:diacylglycerol kinase [Streptomyces sp. DSM 44917]|uniref:Diacylglycerol kinase n=1 Tax=Streptomyces boetiae TaxID=3075541 RepID=A0ABU2LG69_9ACTN|nr:diacylglycerol kinase family protein [Streptomyces sp. DSM 44917]MDT0310542.1 diacylglycerol kinase [Streptomyces sp. DSM 44917]